jgi:hypothetical protein
MHFGCANGFSRLYHTFFGWIFILGHDVYWWSSFLGKNISWFGDFVLMCHSSTFLFHLDSTSSFFLPIFFDEFHQKNYANMWGHHRLRVMGVHSRFLNKVLGPTPNFFWWYMFFIYGGLWPICFSKELCFSASIFVFKVSYLW